MSVVNVASFPPGTSVEIHERTRDFYDLEDGEDRVAKAKKVAKDGNVTFSLDVPVGARLWAIGDERAIGVTAKPGEAPKAAPSKPKAKKAAKSTATAPKSSKPKVVKGPRSTASLKK